jgi:hypothetical protein
VIDTPRTASPCLHPSRSSGNGRRPGPQASPAGRAVTDPVLDTETLNDQVVRARGSCHAHPVLHSTRWYVPPLPYPRPAPSKRPAGWWRRPTPDQLSNPEILLGLGSHGAESGAQVEVTQQLLSSRLTLFRIPLRSQGPGGVVPSSAVQCTAHKASSRCRRPGATPRQGEGIPDRPRKLSVLPYSVEPTHNLNPGEKAGSISRSANTNISIINTEPSVGMSRPKPRLPHVFAAACRIGLAGHPPRRLIGNVIASGC